MSEKWTKGPWGVGKSGPNKMPVVGTAEGLMVAHIAIGLSHRGKENAHLIAAAPELYELLEEASRMMPKQYEDEELWHKEVQRVLKEARGEE